MGLATATISAGRAALDILLPPHCLGCGGWVDRAAQLCPACWAGLTFLHDPCCAACGLPFDAGLGPDAVCARCMAEPPAFARARAALRYDDASSPLILALKHGDRLDGVGSFAGWMARTGAEMLEQADAIAPVPLHRWRLWRRRYNQAALLAQALGRRTGLPVVPDLLLRVRDTPSQGGLSRAQRAENVRGAFRVRKTPIERHVNGKHILLVDDVMTTGATANACARALRQAGAARVSVLVLARALQE